MRVTLVLGLGNGPGSPVGIDFHGPVRGLGGLVKSVGRGRERVGGV